MKHEYIGVTYFCTARGYRQKAYEVRCGHCTHVNVIAAWSWAGHGMVRCKSCKTEIHQDVLWDAVSRK